MVEELVEQNYNAILRTLIGLAEFHRTKTEWAMLFAFGSDLAVNVPRDFTGDFRIRARSAVEHLESTPPEHFLRRIHDPASARMGYKLLDEGKYPIFYFDQYGRQRKG